MAVLLVGLNHRTAPVELRERLALADCRLRMALEEMATLLAPHGLRETVILSTCNRLEVYASAQDVGQAGAYILHTLARMHNLAPGALTPHFYQLQGEAAAAHLMRVACGLDSQILGEPQILGQVTRAFEEARGAGVTGAVLSSLFRRAIRAGKRARTETAISRATTSVSHAAINLGLAAYAGPGTPRLLLVGAGEMMETAAKALQYRNFRATACINRTYTRAQALARRMNGRAYSWHDLHEALAWADVVLTGTSAPHTVIHTEDVQPVLQARTGRPLVFVDVAVPRDVAENVASLPNIHRFDIDDLQATLDESLALRQAAVPQVEAIIAQELDEFSAWLQGRQVVPTIVDLRDKVRRVADQETALALRQLPELSPHERAVVEQVMGKLVHRLVNKFLHEPTVQLKALARREDMDYAAATRLLFGLEPSRLDLPRPGLSLARPGDGPPQASQPSNGRPSSSPGARPISPPLPQMVITHGDD